MATAVKTFEAPRMYRSVGDLYGPTYTITFIAPSTTTPASENFTGSPTSNASTGIISPSDQAQTQLSLDKAKLDNYTAEISISVEGSGPMNATVTLTPPYEDALQIINNRLISLGTVMKIQWGYNTSPSRLSEPHYFYLSEPRVAFQDKQYSIQLTGIDMFSQCLMRRASLVKLRRKDFPSDLSVLAKLAQDLDMQLYVSKSLVAKSGLDEIVTKKRPSDIVGNDWELFQDICHSHNVLFTIEEKDIIRLHYYDDIVLTTPQYSLKMYQQLTGDHDIPVISLNANVIQAWFAPATRSVRHVTTLLDSNTTIVRDVTVATLTKIPSMGSVSDGTVAGLPKTAGKVIDGTTDFNPTPTYNPLDGQVGERFYDPHRQNNTNGRANQLVTEASLRANITASLTAPGHPDVMPPVCIAVSGFGKLDGNYFIKSAKHIIGTRGYDMTLDLIRTTTNDDVGATNPVAGTLVNNPPASTSPQVTSDANTTPIPGKN